MSTRAATEAALEKFLKFFSELFFTSVKVLLSERTCRKKAAGSGSEDFQQHLFLQKKILFSGLRESLVFLY